MMSNCGCFGQTQYGLHMTGPERSEGQGLAEVDVELQLKWARLSKGPSVRGPERGLVEADVELQLLWRDSAQPRHEGP